LIATEQPSEEKTPITETTDEEDDRDYLKIGGHKLSLDEAYRIKRTVDELISEWDHIIRREIPFNDKADKPKSVCNCGSNFILPIDYYIDKTGVLIMLGSCKLCGGYRETPSYDYDYPFPFKEPPNWRGILIVNSNPDKDAIRDMFI
jgi:hypothetical protein